MTFLFPFLFSPFTDGGPLMMSLITICLILSVVFLIKGFTSLKSNAGQSKKMLRLAIDSSLLGLVIGFFASILGLITAFDTVEAMGNPDPSIFAAGLKVSLITATYGLLTFIIARVGILILKGLQKD
ncbi:MotA/TolQ/ExbB proton channel family protein [Hanstruepera marina]|uniref:MotA/TolQ/ExbB proton channel family protein n=1 Tax=Hanstruepera marina TaxID=2873265 RepID=UPI001CA6F564|nr:MotA/TolQ/ExbB proton channel family protein [Hanstruepera marina]